MMKKMLVVGGANGIGLAIAQRMASRVTAEMVYDVFIPKYEVVFKEVLQRYDNDFRMEGIHCYDYKMNSKR